MKYPIQILDIQQFINSRGMKEISKIDEILLLKINEIVKAINDEYFEEVKND